MTFQCDECGKSLATEGGLGIHMQTHQRVAPEPLEVIDVLEAVPVDAPSAAKPAGRALPDLSALVPAPLLVTSLAIAIVVMFLMGTTVAIRPSLIRDSKHATSVAAGSTSHSVPIPQTPATTPSTAAPTTAPPASPAHPAPAAAGASDDTRVRSLVLQLSDYGPGWELDSSGGSGGSSSADNSNIDAQIAQCMGADLSGPDNSVGFDGPAVTRGTLAASTSATIFPTSKEADADYGVINDPRLAPCMKAAIEKELQAEGVPANAVRITTQHFVIPAGNVKSGGLRFVVSASGPGGTVSMFVDLLVLQLGRAESTATFTSQGSQMPGSMEQALVLRMADKLRSAGQVSA